jgi:hypothetical protein
MTGTGAIAEPVIVIAGIAVILASGCAVITAILGVDSLGRGYRARKFPLLEHEKDVAAALGWRWRSWLALRAAVVIGGVLVGSQPRSGSWQPSSA